MMFDEEDFDCPLCMEELDISDRNFRPCPCGYQICRFCWHHIKEDLNGRCPACRRIYSEETVQFTPISADELTMIKNEKKAKEREKKEMEAMNRKHLSNMRVVQKSLVYVIGLPAKLANDEHTLRQHEYFGQYGKIAKVVINRRNATTSSGSLGQGSVGVYITYVRKEDATKAIAAIDGSVWDGKILRASYGTTKYCTYYLRGMTCQNPGCMYLHEPGEDADSFTKEDLAVGKHHHHDHSSSHDSYGHKHNNSGRPSVPTHGSGPSLTPKSRPATVSSFHSNASSLSDWPAPGGDRPSHDDKEKEKDKDKDKEEEVSLLPATASWAKIGSNPSTPTLNNTAARKLEGPPPLRPKGSVSSMITGAVVNNVKRKEINYVRDGPLIDDSPTPAEALALEAAARQQMLQEQRQLQEQQRKQQLLLQKQQQEAEQQAELLKQKLKKQRELELEQEQLELQKKKQQQEMELKLQKQKEKEQQRKEQERLEQLQREKEEQEKARREKELKEEQERKEQKERQEREEKERLEKERLEKERLEKERLEKERLEKERLEKERLQKEQEREERERKEREEREKQEREEQERKDKEAREEQQRKEREEQLRKEREEQLRKEREEQEKMEREEREERERKEREEQERKEREEREHHKKQAQLVQNQPVLPLGSFTFNPDASLATLPAAFSNPDGDSAIRPEVAGPFGLDSLVLSSFPLSPTHYTGSFNPFSLEDEPLMRRPTASSARSYLDDSDYDPTMGHNRPLGPPIPGKPRQASRFGFAIDHQYSDSLAREEQSDRTANVQSMQDGFRALFPNVNISFGQSNNALPHNQHQQQLHSLHQQHHQPQHQLQYQVPSIPNHSDVQNANMWTSSDKQESAVFQRSMNQLNIDRMLAIPNPRMAEYHQQHSQQHNGPPGLAHSNMTPTMMKSPPPGLENFARWPLPHHHHQQQQQQQQFQQHLQMQMQQAQRPHQDSRLGNWTSDNNVGSQNLGNRNSQDNAQDFFGAFLKAAAAAPPSTHQSSPITNSTGLSTSMAFQDPAIMSARISSSNISRQPLVETLQPSYTVAPGTFNSMGYGPGSDMAGRAGLNHTSSPLQQFGLGPKRMENYPPIKPNGMEPYPMVFGLGESPLMNTINSAASARAAKVKSDLLMGLNAGIRPDRLNMKDQSLQSQTQQYTQLTDEHNNILNSLNGGLRTGSPIDGNANSGAPPISGEYSGVSSGFASTSLNTPMISLPLSSTPLTTSSAAISVSGPPPGLSLPTVNSNNAADSNSSKDNDNNVNDNSNGGNGSTVATSYMNITGPNNNNTNTTKPIDIASMMSVLDFFGSSTSVAMSSPNNWVPSAANGTGLIGHHYQQQQHQQQHQQHHPHRPRDMTFIQGGPGLLPNRESFQTGLGFGMDAGQHPQQHQFQHQAQLQHHFLQRQHQQHQQHQQQQQQQRMLGNLDMINGTGYGNGPGNDSNGSNTNTNTAESTPQLSHVSESDVSAAANARSVEDLELQVINAKMETQMLENQLNAVIKRNRRKLYA